MKRSSVVILFAALAAFTLSISLFLSARSAEAQREAAVRWEYAAITGAFPTLTNDNPTTTASASANICYMQAVGCVNEEVKADLAYSKFFQDAKVDNNQSSRANAQTKVVEMAMSKAIFKLGSEGWEMVSSPGLQYMTFLPNTGGGYDVHEGIQERQPDIYFKRLKR
jgi:hypothetical protein